MQMVNYCLLYYFLGEAKNDYTAAIVGGSITGVALIHVSQIKKGWFSKSQLTMNEMARHFYSKFFNHVFTSKKKTPPSCEAVKLKKGRIYEVDSF